ncbi:uncharacterized protein Veg [Streptomyces griseochromogenes]|uniref:Uncharacterized protein Veg n=1 Tax=Streptomyces griseochromogenes TaxID=68214 RepID=A0ABS4M8U1_9ACTN|nr:hypothetical protein [Streptomyces griseochromogenes]MBP2056093.1 uncharacterized protein Veg [Streptomyces griseochromogenes]
MGQPYENVNYDWAAADNLVGVLTALHAKIGAVIELRTNKRRELLGANPCDVWQGARRSDFEGAFRSEQRDLTKLKEEISAIKGAVLDLTAEARSVNRGAH